MVSPHSVIPTIAGMAGIRTTSHTLWVFTPESVLHHNLLDPFEPPFSEQIRSQAILRG